MAKSNYKGNRFNQARPQRRAEKRSYERQHCRWTKEIFCWGVAVVLVLGQWVFPSRIGQ